MFLGKLMEGATGKLLLCIVFLTALGQNYVQSTCQPGDGSCLRHSLSYCYRDRTETVRSFIDPSPNRNHRVCKSALAGNNFYGCSFSFYSTGGIRVTARLTSSSCTQCCDNGECCLYTSRAADLTIICSRNSGSQLTLNIDTYSNQPARYCSQGYLGAPIPVVYTVETCEDDKEISLVKISEFYSDLQKQALLQDGSLDEESFFAKPVERCEDRENELKDLSYSAVIYINSPDVVLRRAARVALNIV